MPSGDGYQDGEGNGSPNPSCMDRSVPVEQTDRAEELADSSGGSTSGMASGSGSCSGEDEEVGEQLERRCVAEEGGGKPFGREQDQEDVEMKGGHISEGKRQYSSSAESTTESGSTKSKQAEQGRVHTHQEMMQMVQEIKKGLPSEKKSCSKANTVEALNYALNCVKQVQANSEYYKLLMCNGLEERKDAKVCSLERLEAITSEHMLKNTDTFVVVFSLATGRVVYASAQASNILNCKRKFLNSAKFVELLFHQDVNVFYSHTAQPRLPPWNVGTDSSALLFECAQVKSFFCRIRGGKDRDGEMRYNPFRITPYLLKLQGLGGEEEHPCCLALAERIISGYEAPRIPTDKRIFTTTHSPGCVFLEVDDRAVPLLGYLPQDLIGTSVLTCLHPEDRTLMLALHRKIVKYVGQPPFEHSPIRLRCQNGDYVTLDTSWSSFVNPWSRKVAFIIGRHKVRTGPLNEDVFDAQSKAELPVTLEDVKELQAMIYKLFLQPVHTNGSSGYSSLGSNGSHEQYISMASSSDSNGNLWEDSHREPVTLQQICVNVNKVKSGGQQAYLDSRRKVTTPGKVSKETPALILHDGQCLEVQRLRGSIEDSHRKQPHIPSYQQINCVDGIIRYLKSCSGSALKRKSESISIATSSSSTTSEEDKTPAARPEDKTNADEAAMEVSAGQESQISAESMVTVAHRTAAVIGAPLTDMTLSTKAMSVVSVTSQCSYSSTIVHVPQPESEVTALEDAPMGSGPADTAPTLSRLAPSSSAMAPEEFQVVGLTKKVLSVHTEKEEQEYVDRFRHRILESPFSSFFQQDNSSMAHSNHRGDYVTRPQSTGDWNRSHSGKPRHKRAKPQASSDSDGSRPGHFLPMTSSAPKNSSSKSSHPNPTIFSPMLMPLQPPYYSTLPHPCAMPPAGALVVLQPEQTQPVMQVMTPFMSPVMAVIMPYPSGYTIYPQAVAGMPGVTPPGLLPPPLPNPSFVSLMDNPPAQTETSLMPSASKAFLSSPILSPWPEEDVDGAQPTVMFSSSRSSSPLQLNLLPEELPKPNAAQSNTESLHEQRVKEDAPSESGNQDAQSTYSVLLDLLLQEDARAGTGSNASGSGSGESWGSLGSGSGLGSNGTSTSLTGSSNSSKYFASNDSSDTSCKVKKSQDAPERSSFDNRVQDSLWTMIQHMPEPVMMTYQIHPRDQDEVLKEDRKKLLLLQPMQPWFTQEQKEELAKVHSWIQHHSVPEETNTHGCMCCNLTTVEGSDTAAHSPSLSAPDSSLAQDCPTEGISPASDT